ncbi:hypothetical protein ZYGR_0AD02200 [Zygosaccharomyces rouxii]|uniref:ZYRO0G11066p n=2 Tax=Zygosaccharomyces rouxii TaxID=4956 RepID=C5E0A4_ZYGRC|nr:uncharacterized protein ZYRO0G11066g [Zygosaccharomyces rouxii]KAH9202532.1 hypothetical protein LQ764DRAFT_207507 [Zygosaccharomyces rouxii]GAV51037.1 hypothetical protein ZYGR_0AD02200 [Zygosaccharomyces rouxii]CAR29538.1 ZYRO0G11066p [Zygosaccharomyces rouxii]
MSGIITGLIGSYGQGWLQDKANEYAEEHFQPTKDPYYEELPSGKKVRRRLPDYCSKQESKAYKKLQNQAWSHDKGMCGGCCWSECIGWAPLLTIIPIIGPAIMYSIHGKMVDRAQIQFDLPQDMVLKMHGNIGVDLAIALVPVLGIVFSWMNACSTRNCAMVYNFVSQRAIEAHNQKMRGKAGIAETKRNDKAEAAQAKQNAKAAKHSKSPTPVAAATPPASAPAATSNVKSSKYTQKEVRSASPPLRNVPNTVSPFERSSPQPYSRPAAPLPPPSAAMPNSAVGGRVGGGNPYVVQSTNQSYPMQDWGQRPYQRPPAPTPGPAGTKSRAQRPYI